MTLIDGVNVNRVILILTLLLLLTGCEESVNTFYTYGLDNSCYKNNNIEKCLIYKPYDVLKVSVNKQNQEISYQLMGVGLDETNIIFKKINNCVVVDINNFSCENFVSVNGKITNSKSLGNKIVSSVYWLFEPLSLINRGLNKSVIKFVDNNNSWLSVIGCFLILGFIFSLLGT